MSALPRVLVRALTDARNGHRAEIVGDEAHHLVRVLRVRVGDKLVVFDGIGNEALARVESTQTRGVVSVRVCLEESMRPGVRGDAASVILLQGYPKGDKLDTVVRQATELGVCAIWPVYTARAVPRGCGEKRIARWQAIASSAAAQCGRADVPEVRQPTGLQEALMELTENVTVRLVPWEVQGIPLGDALATAPAAGGCAVLVGPEGGLEESEVALAKDYGFVPVSLGPRILRTETVAPALLAVLSFARGDLRRLRSDGG